MRRQRPPTYGIAMLFILCGIIGALCVIAFVAWAFTAVISSVSAHEADESTAYDYMACLKKKSAVYGYPQSEPIGWPDFDNKNPDCKQFNITLEDVRNALESERKIQPPPQFYIPPPLPPEPKVQEYHS